jgi:hypothetical protein
MMTILDWVLHTGWGAVHEHRWLLCMFLVSVDKVRVLLELLIHRPIFISYIPLVSLLLMGLTTQAPSV